MQIQFGRTGEERKALVTAIGEILETKPQYMGAPGFAYRIGVYTVTKDGTLECDGQEDASALLSALAARGFLPVLKEPAGTGLDGVFAIDLPFEDAGGLAQENLKKLVMGKASLIRAALGGNLADDTLPVIVEDGKASFPWFRLGIDADSIAAWSHFVCALCDTAKKQKRVVMSQKPYDGSEKYAMRCFLLKLGFIGDEYKEARRVILANLSGNGSHKKPKDAPSCPADESDRLVYGGLCCVPPTDGNYASYLRDATDEQLGKAIAQMEASPEGNKGRIAVCRRELEKRRTS